MSVCGRDGCVRPAGHLGGHTLWPHPTTWDFDLSRIEVEAAVAKLRRDIQEWEAA